MNLQKKYSREDFLDFVKSFVPGYDKDIRKVKTDRLKVTSTALYLGESSDLDLAVFELKHTSSSDARVTLATEGFRIMKDSANYRALVAYVPEGSDDWRLSLMTATPEKSGKGKVFLKLSNPKRYSFFLGENAKINTPHKFLIKQGSVSNFEDLQNRFSLEVVNKEFYKQISESFIKLVGGTLGTGKKEKKYKALLQLPSVSDHSQTSLEFGVRLIGRIIFCWFLREKRSSKGEPLMPKKLLSLDASKKHSDYYHKVLEPIFFEVLNKPVKSRDDEYTKNSFADIPYLNGGLFSPHEDDFFSYSEGRQAINHNTVIVPDSWLKELFETLETYNFTIDENTSFDEELSIDPEMLGRIFENLLAEINPETGESARKSTGSYYTPRVIVDYMVDESLILYLKQKTGVSEEKIRAVVSYDLTDDAEHPLNKDEKTKIVDALESLTLLDPACGSGAFPIGALQKIVFILQQLDPNGHLWFTKQLAKTPPELRRVLEREFENKNFDYIRKLGIIRENIYGVDIQPIATEISRLRCFLTLIVDERVDDNLENRGIEPLPNLDFKFVTANTLIGLPKIDTNQQTLFDDTSKIDELKSLRDQYFTSRNSERKDLMLAFSDLQTDMINDLIEKHSFTGVAKAELTRKLTEWKPFKHKSTDWFDTEWMFGIKDGFDIVIANPPYIKEYVNKSAFIELKQSPYYQGKMDFWYFFTCKGIDLLKPQVGVLCFIAQNNWPTNYGASKMRNKIIQECQIISLVDFTDYKVFDAGVQTMVFLLKKNYPKESYETRYAKVTDKSINVEAIRELLLNLNGEIEGTTRFEATIDPQYLINKNIVFTDKSDHELLDKIESKRNFALAESEVAQGIVAAPDKYFVIHDLTMFNNKELAYIKPFYTSTNKYGSSLTKSYIIYLCGKNFDNNKIEDYPNIKNHFEPFKNDLKEAKIKYGTPEKPYYYLHREREERFFKAGPKVVGQTRTSTPSFLYTEEEYYGSRAMNFIKTNRVNLKYLVGFLNSRISYFWLKKKGKQLGNLLQIDKGPLLGIPICKPDEETQQVVANLVEKIISIYNEHNNGSLDDNNELTKKKIKHIEQQVDKIFYKLYCLKSEDVEVIEKNTE